MKKVKVNLEMEKRELIKLNRRLDRELPVSNRRFAFTKRPSYTSLNKGEEDGS